MDDKRRSPTVWMAYADNPSWWTENGGGAARGHEGFDFDMFDADGYDSDGVDRMGYTRADYDGGDRVSARRMAEAKTFGGRFAANLSLRIPAVKAKAIVDAARPLLEEAFLSDDVAIRMGVNADGTRYIGAERAAEDGFIYFSVIADKRGRLPSGHDAWCATVLWLADGDPQERWLQADSLEALMEAVGGEVAACRDRPTEHVVYIVDAGTSEARFGALAAVEFDGLADGKPGDEIVRLKADGPVDALKAFRGNKARSDGFEDMIEQGLLAAPSLRPR